MRRLSLAIGLSIVAAGIRAGPAARAERGAAAQQTVPVPEAVPARGIERLEQWLKAIVRHEPGSADDAAIEVGSWPQGDVQTLWIDANVLVTLMRNPGALQFTLTPAGQHKPRDIRYTPGQLVKLRALACAATGAVAAEAGCQGTKAAGDLDADLLHLSGLAWAARQAGDGDNYVLRRGALLHTDVAMAVPAAAEPIETPLPLGPQRIKVNVADGRQVYIGQFAVHWEIARTLLDLVKPHAPGGPAPGRDRMVRRWYRATAAWMQQVEDHDTVHLDRAREIFPADPDILFLSGSQHETYAGPRIRNAVRSAALPFGLRFAIASEGEELHAAEGFFRHALEIKPDHIEARLRHGRVLGELGRHNDAAEELRLAVAAIGDTDSLLRYYGDLFLGGEEEAIGRHDAARLSFEHAAALYPLAQSPWIALSQLARRRGDRPGALRAIEHVLALPAEAKERDDPWWTYHTAQARDADTLLQDLRKPFLTAAIR
jgi:tetratricopeptide (TPR) repeat protein